MSKQLNLKYLFTKGYTKEKLTTSTRLHFANDKIETVDENTFKEFSCLKELNLENNKLKSIGEQFFRYLTSLTKLWLQKNQIEEINEKAFSYCTNLTHLHLENNLVKRIEANTFRQLTYLIELWLHDNQIDIIHENGFNDCFNLNKLFLEKNKLTKIDASVFQGLTNLVELCLQENQIKDISEKAFENCASLKLLNLANNKLTSLHEMTFSKLTNLVELWLEDNQLESLNSNLFNSCTSITHLHLSNNKLTQINREIFEKLTKLTGLWLNENQLESIDEKAFQNCTSLTHLYIDNNKLKTINESLFQKLTELRELAMGNNQIETIDEKAFVNCFKLAKLYLNGNKLKRIDENTFKMQTSLLELWLWSNQIEQIETNAFENCINLRQLSLYSNNLTRIDQNVFKNLTNLTQIWLEENQIEHIDEKALENCSKLTHLYLAKNKLTKIDEILLNRLENLTELSLQENQIEYIDKRAFENCSSLTHLYLEKNRLTRIEKILFSRLGNLTKLNLQENQLETIEAKAFEKTRNLVKLRLDHNQIVSIERNLFANLKKIEKIDLSNNCLAMNTEIASLNLVFNSSKRNVEINLSFNLIQKAKLEFCLSDRININISSNDLKNVSDIDIKSKNEKALIEVNARFNSIQLNPMKNQRKNNFNLDLANNPCEKVNSNKYKKYEEKLAASKQNEKEADNKPNRFFKKINFNFLKERYPFFEGLKVWQEFSPFSVITGKNGAGKSTVLNYIKDYLLEFYKNELYLMNRFENKANKTDHENIMKKNLFIPVIYRMHDTIKPDIGSIRELKELGKDYLNAKNAENAHTNKISWENFKQVVNIFLVDSIDKLILQFKTNINRINQHLLNDFKYEIKLNDSLTRVSFLNRYNPKTKELNSSDLSPGEQLMLLFRLWEFALTRYEIPHTPVLLLDEPDAHLHPQKVHEFVQILEKLSEAGAQIIMTTHNPTTVSLVKKENLYCMKSKSDGSVSIKKAKLKTDVIRELTDNLILVNEPYRVVLVEGGPHEINLNEPKYQSKERDALFYRFVHSLLSESNKDNIFSKFQLVFKSYSGHDNILGLLKSLDQGKMYQDHYAIIDNDNFFQICSNQPEEIEHYYANRTKRRFNLLRHSLENYILDPVNLFVYMNFYLREMQLGKKNVISVNEENLEKLIERVLKEMPSLNKNNTLITKVSEFENNKNFFKTMVTVLGRDLVEYITQFDGFGYRIFKQKEVINNYLNPIFRYVGNNYFTNQGSFCSVNFLKNARDKLSTSHVIKKNDPRLAMLDEPDREKTAIKEEMEEVKSIVNCLYEKSDSFKNLELENLNLSNLSDTLEKILKNEEFLNVIKSTKIVENQNDLKSRLFEFIDGKIDTKIEALSLKLFLNAKFQLDEFIIDEIKKYLLVTVDCCFFEYETLVIKYPRVFYRLRGHYLEKVIYSMYFNESEEYSKSKLINDLLADQGAMKSCGYLIPNELTEIFKRILHVDSVSSSSDSCSSFSSKSECDNRPHSEIAMA